MKTKGFNLQRFGMLALVFVLPLVGLPHFTLSLKAQHPKFTQVVEKEPNVLLDVRYFGSNNFTGRPVVGYSAPKVYLTHEAADSLQKVVALLVKQGYGIKIFDAYRPQRAVDAFGQWAGDISDTVRKQTYYPDVAKSDLFSEGYIAARSGHSRGSTVDLTLIDLSTGKELDMGSPYDYFGPESHPFYTELPDRVKQNRALLRSVMMACGFKPIHTEWWHFTLAEEPYPDTYFNFEIR